MYINNSKCKEIETFSWVQSTVKVKDASPECLKESLQAVVPGFIHGIPELEITSLDPFEVESLVFSLPGDITIEFKEAYTKGLRKCIVDFVRRMAKDTFDIQFQCDLTSRGKYRSSGRLLTFPVNGEGKSTIISKILKIRCSFHLSSVIKADGQKYMHIENFKTTHSFEGRVIYNMTNLFKGNSEMSNLVLNFMNENWRLVADEFGSPLIDYGINSVLHNVKKLLDAVPIDNLLMA